MSVPADLSVRVNSKSRRSLKATCIYVAFATALSPAKMIACSPNKLNMEADQTL